MPKIKQKSLLEQRRLRNRKSIVGTSYKPRLTVFRSNKYTYAQLVDDMAHKTLVSVDSKVKTVHESVPKADAAYKLGELLAQEALKKNIKRVIFDRGSYKYHGRVKSLADGARSGGLIF
ncbi:50S ribosomal protein L18 [candidate division WWE3 bacterium]|uniref:Large ribosomal subunit protein uL18 n=1 Tax=candidate division WWE3 bacterium TaxID=2053526 RepID=A0A955ECC7_UNCKA|nr:50S ribosomal protein L18 [candidate division WWE3 bacterium]